MRSLAIANGVAVVVISLIAFFELEAGFANLASDESGVLEICHNILLFEAAALFLMCFYETGPGAMKLAAGIMSGACTIAFIRELEFDPSLLPVVWPSHAGAFKKSWLMAAVVGSMLAIVWKYRAFVAPAIAIGFERSSWPIYIAGALVVIALLLDHAGSSSIQILDSHFWEEMAETYAYGFLVYAAIRHRELARQGS